MNKLTRMVLLACAGVTVWAADVNAILSAGDLQAKSGNYRNAANFYRAALKLDPSQAGTYEKLADAYSHLGMNKEAAELLEKEANLLLAKSPATQVAAQQATAQPTTGSAPAKQPAGCSSEAAFKYVVSDRYEGVARRPGGIRVIYQSFEIGPATPYWDPYNRAVDTKAYPVKTEFTVREFFSDATEEHDHDERYMCYSDTHRECVCTMQTGGRGTGKLRHIPK